MPTQATASRTRLYRAICWVVIVVGLFVLAHPIATQWWEAWQASQAINRVVNTYNKMDDPERSALRDEARAYNEALVGQGSMLSRLPYEEQFSYQGSAMIAFIVIPKCSVKLPILHGVEDEVLSAGVGHLRSTSLPAGGESSHCVLTAHTGMPERRMFDDINLLERGDEFVIWVLGEPLAYRVTGSEVVLPDQMDSLAVQPGRDLCTLVTCTPYGVNTHRLLVHAERCEYKTGEDAAARDACHDNIQMY